jgi:hypothetical protein
MAELLEEIERRIEGLRTEVRRAAMSGDSARARELRADLRQAERAWDDALAAPEQDADQARQSGPPPPPARAPSPPSPNVVTARVREQVHQVLSLLSVPAEPKLITAVYGAFFAGEIVGAQLTSLRRDERRSFQSAPHARPYYLCCALTADRLVPARGLLAVSTWSMARRTIGPLSTRVDFLTAAIRLAEQVDGMGEPALPALKLLSRFATAIPGAAESLDSLRPTIVADAARAELAIHQEADRAHREAAASRARTRLDETRQLFGSALKPVRRVTTKD